LRWRYAGGVTDPITATAFHALSGIPEWRYLLGRIHATFDAGSVVAAASFVGRIAEAEAHADHFADLDLRPPGLVHVSLATLGTRVTSADVSLATTISAIAAADGLASRPVVAPAVEVAIDALDIDAVRPFWKAVLGYDDEPPPEPGGQVFALVDPARIGPAFWFQQMDAIRPERNHIHIDVTVPHDLADERIAAALAAGGSMVSDDRARAFWVLADAEGNEACICTWQDRD
jgi:4a-hydroxytetrahydrobiopterin dehydratase